MAVDHMEHHASTKTKEVLLHCASAALVTKKIPPIYLNLDLRQEYLFLFKDMLNSALNRMNYKPITSIPWADLKKNQFRKTRIEIEGWPENVDVGRNLSTKQYERLIEKFKRNEIKIQFDGLDVHADELDDLENATAIHNDLPVISTEGLLYADEL